MSNQIQSTLNIEGMACSRCSGAVQSALSDLEGIENANAIHEDGTAFVSYDRECLSADDFAGWN